MNTMTTSVSSDQCKSIMKWFSRYKYLLILLFVFLIFSILWFASLDAEQKYQKQLSVTIYDRNGIPLSIEENTKGHYVKEIKNLPEEFENLLILKEDKYFRYHFGINPFSNVRAIYSKIISDRAGGASTITQQLSKNLLGTELERNVLNKLREAFYSVGIEIFYTKDEILTMYANTVYLGNQIQGFETGSYAYFGKPLSETTHSEQISLLATLSYPNARNPWEDTNAVFAEALNNRISPQHTFTKSDTVSDYSFRKDSYFELSTAGVGCNETCRTTIDNELSEKIRAILNRHIESEWERGARNGSVVVIDPMNSEIIAIIGSKDPNSQSNGDQINMAITPRPIGSTVKPFIYLKGFIDGLRPYTLVDDREYKYSIATGFPLYPKNYDGQYRGEVTLHEALSNSLNVPSVKILEFIGLNNFYSFLSEKLKFEPIQSYESYQYGIALGGLEMDLLTLTHYFTIFPRMGTIEPLRILSDSTENFALPPQSDIQSEQKISDEKYTQLVHAILSDRYSGVDQFGLVSTFNIDAKDYGIKTGTSRDFHDSWIVGYTGDFVVGVWIGNTENEPLKQVTGQSGAGAVWHDVMNVLLESPYNKNTVLSRSHITQSPILNSNEWILSGEEIDSHRNLLQTNNLILSPYNNDSFELFTDTTLTLKASKKVEWFINGESLGESENTTFSPKSAGNYEIMVIDNPSKRREIITIKVTLPQ